MNSSSAFPGELKFLRFIFALGAGTGLFLLIIRLLGLFVGNVLKQFSEDPGSLLWILNFLAFGVPGTMVSVRVLQLLRVREPSFPGLIVLWVWWLVLAEILLSLAAFLHSGDFFDFPFNYIPNLFLWSFFYVWTSSQFRYLKVVGEYYGAVASPSRIGWMSQLEGWMLRVMKAGQENNILVSHIKF